MSCCGMGCNPCKEPTEKVDFVVYGQPNCQPCTQVKRLLTSEGYRIRYVDIYNDSEARQGLISQGVRGVPFVTTDSGERIGTYTEVLDKIRNNKL